MALRHESAAACLPMDAIDRDYRAGLRSALLIFVTLTASRLAFNLAVIGRTGPGVGDSRRATKAEKNCEETWLGIGTLWLMGWSWWALGASRAACGVLDTSACVADWPDIPVSAAERALFEAEVGWYMHMLTRGWVGVGFAQDAAMAVHHVLAVCLIVAGYGLGLTRLGVVALAVFNLSNPFLHASKVANNLQMARCRVALFALFGATFFVSRVVLLPTVIMKCTLLETLPVLAREPRMWWAYYGGNAVIAALYLMQLMWMAKILRVLCSGKSGATPKGAIGEKGPFQETKTRGGNGAAALEGTNEDKQLMVK